MDSILIFLGNNWFSLIALLIIIPIANGFKKAIEKAISDIPQKLHEKRMEEIKQENSLFLQQENQKSVRELQIDSYYRSISGKSIEKLFSDWTDLILDSEKINKTPEKRRYEKLNQMIKDVVIYGSAETVRLASILQQYNFRTLENIDDERNPYELMYLGAIVICSMKKDFTGHEIQPEQLFDIKIKDMYKDKTQEQFKSAKNVVEKILKDGF